MVTQKISNVELLWLRYTFPSWIRYEYSGGVVENQDVALVRVTCDSGACGYGEITHGQYCHHPITGLIEHFREMLIGHPVGEINGAWEKMYGSSVFWNRQGVGIGVMGGINIAMYDLLGKLMQVPVYQLLGGLARSRSRVYASNGLFREKEPLIADAQRARSAGFTAYKMRVVTPETLIPLVAAFKEAMPGMDLIVDAVQGSCSVPWSISVSKQLAQKLEEYGVLWFEEPCRVENIEGYVEMRRSTQLNIAGAESLPTAEAFKPYLDREAFGIVQFDVATSGFTEGLRIASLAAVHHRPVAIHSWGSVVSALAGLHLSLVIPNCAITEYSFMDHPLNDLLATRPFRPVEGYVTAPEIPGLGVQFDESLLSVYPYEPSPNSMISVHEKEIQLSYKNGESLNGHRPIPTNQDGQNLPHFARLDNHRV
jgi:L-alanine-DL-glutamate epimerase-like enolase superfamily enzyme